MGAVQVERIRRWRAQQHEKSTTVGTWDGSIKLWIPLETSESSDGGAVVSVTPELGLFDFGPSQNWRNLMGDSWVDWLKPWVRV